MAKLCYDRWMDGYMVRRFIEMYIVHWIFSVCYRNVPHILFLFMWGIIVTNVHMKTNSSSHRWTGDTWVNSGKLIWIYCKWNVLLGLSYTYKCNAWQLLYFTFIAFSLEFFMLNVIQSSKGVTRICTHNFCISTKWKHVVEKSE